MTRKKKKEKKEGVGQMRIRKTPEMSANVQVANVIR